MDSHVLQSSISKTMPFSYCFLCHRILTKSTTLLRHLDACTNKLSELKITNKQCIISELCNECYYSLTEHEKHTWGHAKK